MITIPVRIMPARIPSSQVNDTDYAKLGASFGPAIPACDGLPNATEERLADVSLTFPAESRNAVWTLLETDRAVYTYAMEGAQ